MIHHLLPVELWNIIAGMLNRLILPKDDSIELKLPHPVRYELIIDDDGRILDIRECVVM